jgi:lysophospholipid acyltransferase (LPLAT)-like uncharacterized protein
MLKTIGRSKLVLGTAGFLLAAYLKFVWATTCFKTDPQDHYQPVYDHMPFILASWHGLHLMVPLARRKDHPVTVLVSRSADGEINAAAARSMGLSVIRGSGGRNQKKAAKKGGAAGFLRMKSTLEEGTTVAQTADVPRGTARRCGLGIVTLALHSGRPIVPVAVATRHFVQLKNWDRTRIPLPFGRGGVAVGRPVYVGTDDNDPDLQAARTEVETEMNRTQQSADALAGLVAAAQ